MGALSRLRRQQRAAVPVKSSGRHVGAAQDRPQRRGERPILRQERQQQQAGQLGMADEITEPRGDHRFGGFGFYERHAERRERMGPADQHRQLDAVAPFLNARREKAEQPARARPGPDQHRSDAAAEHRRSGEREGNQHQVIKGLVVAQDIDGRETQIDRYAPPAGQAVIAAGDRVPLIGDEVEDLAEGDRHHREIDAAQAHDQGADHGGRQGARGNADRDAEQRARHQVFYGEADAVNAEAEIGGMTERQNPGEAQEEIGLDPTRVEVLGIFSPVFTVVSNFLIIPVVAFLSQGLGTLQLQPSEVAEVLLIPLQGLANPAIMHTEEWTHGGRARTVYFYDYGPYRIWGATARILNALLVLLEDGTTTY